MERMSPLDASFLHIEDARNHMHIGSVAIFEGPPPTYDEFAGMLTAKLPRVPRYRQVVRFTPYGLGRPVWADDPDFNIGYHVRHTALAPPGGEDALREIIGRIMSQQLDRSKPLWELWVVEGLDKNRWALISKVHHCMVDGVSGSDLLAVILDHEREPAPPEVEDRWLPAPRAFARPAGRPGAHRAGTQPLRVHPRRPVAHARPARGGRPARCHRLRPRVVLGDRPSQRPVLAQRLDRPAPDLGLGPTRLSDVKIVRGRLRRHRQRRRAGGHHPWLPRPADVTRRVGARARRAHHGAGVGPAPTATAAPGATRCRPCSRRCPWASTIRSIA